MAAGSDVSTTGSDVNAAGNDVGTAGSDVTAAGSDVSTAGSGVGTAGNDVSTAGSGCGPAGAGPDDVTGRVFDLLSRARLQLGRIDRRQRVGSEEPEEPPESPRAPPGSSTCAGERRPPEPGTPPEESEPKRPRPGPEPAPPPAPPPARCGPRPPPGRPSPRARGPRGSRCGRCRGCRRGQDCGHCPNCRDKPKFGGPNTKKQCCVLRRCDKIEARKLERLGRRGRGPRPRAAPWDSGEESGDRVPQDEGRLLYLGQNEWAHVNCALWSAEVFEEGDGTLRNVHAAVARGRQMRCEHCGRPGATVGCCLAACAANYHFMCARRCQAAFLRDKRVFCQRHGRLLAGDELVRDGAFAVLRRVLVDFGGISLKRKFLGGLEPEAVNVMIGSIRIDRLGALSELSEREGRLFPVGYQCWRLYWSTRDARRRCWYRCRILEQPPGPAGGGAGTPPGPPPEHNRTIAHGSPGWGRGSGPSPLTCLPSPPPRLQPGTPAQPGGGEGRPTPPRAPPPPRAGPSPPRGRPPPRRPPPGGCSRPLPPPGQPPAAPRHIPTAGDPAPSPRPRRPRRALSPAGAARRGHPPGPPEPAATAAPRSMPLPRPSSPGAVTSPNGAVALSPDPMTSPNGAVALSPDPVTSPDPMMSPNGAVAAPRSPTSPPGPPRLWGQRAALEAGARSRPAPLSPCGATGDDSAVPAAVARRGRYLGHARAMVAPALSPLSPLSPCPRIQQLDGADDGARGTPGTEGTEGTEGTGPPPPGVPPPPEGLPPDIVDFVLRGVTNNGDTHGDMDATNGDTNATSNGDTAATSNGDTAATNGDRDTNGAWQGHRLGDIAESHQLGDIVQGHRLGDITQGHQLGNIGQSHQLGDIRQGQRLGDIAQSHQLGDIAQGHQLGDISQSHQLGDIAQGHQLGNAQGHRLGDIGQGHHLGDIDQSHQPGDIAQGHRLGATAPNGHGDALGTPWGHPKRPGEGTGPGTKRPRLELDTGDSGLKEEPEELMSDSCGSPPGDVTAEPPWASCAGGSSEEEEPGGGGASSPPPGPAPSPPLPHLRFEISSEDGLRVTAPSLEGAWRAVLERVQEARANAHLRHLSFAGMSGLRLLGIHHDAVVFLLEQLPGAGRCSRYRFRYHPPPPGPPHAPPPRNPSGCARAELYLRKCTFDMFSFLASQHRALPQGPPAREEEEDEVQLKPTRRATSLELPMAMRFRHLKRTAKEAVGVYRSAIHGRGLFCKRNIEAGEMVIEYSGIVVRSVLTDKREKFYDSKGIGCYMFRIDEAEVVDATMHGSAARFINHSCEPNCYSRVIHVEGHKRIVIFALRRILRGEELTYDYKFPIEEPAAKLPCNCGARRCRRFLN
ncbi:LOW QUALITY PROTEIN: histone-lysine N-methyltransferase 2B-like [Passer domesticus]|uniref:LOW QUALITY PROTEIN: histone-lysine N-methyltransferase 2B-like n=1 Tax=Passer domesticus TaxID=48849 RepID=UPI0030FEE586